MHLMKMVIVSVQTRFSMREAGYSKAETRDAVRKLEWKHVEQAAKMAGPEVAAKWATAPPLPAEGEVGAPGDHPFIEWLVAFLNSPEGHALIQALIAILLGLL